MNESTTTENRTSVKLHPAAQKLFDDMQAQGFPGWAYLKVDEARAAFSGLRSLAGEPEPVAHVEDIEIPAEPNITARVYVPRAERAMPVVVHFHAGGWMLGECSDIDTPVRALAKASGCAFVSVNYRLAPEHKFPAALHDAYSAVTWASLNGDRFGWDGSRLAVSGDSSGGNLAAAVCLMCRDQQGPAIQFQLLIYPVLDSSYDNESYRKFGDTFPSRTDMTWFHCNYLSHPDQLRLPYVSPMRTPDASHLPAALIILPEADPLHDEGLLYAKRLTEEGGSAEAKVYAGMIHGFWQFGALFDDAGRATRDAASALRAALSI